MDLGYLIAWVKVNVSLADMCPKDKGIMCLHVMDPCFRQVSKVTLRAEREAYRLDVGMDG